MALYKNEYSRDAVMINGRFLEDLLPNHFYTLTSSGRESLSKEINSSSYKRNGTIKNYTRFPEKVITINFVIDGDTEEEFRENMNQLASLLDVEDADIQFNDEIDKFCIGTLSINAFNKKNGLWAEGSYRIICQDPFMYSTEVQEAAPTIISGNEATFNINYQGNQPSHPLLKVSFGTNVSSGAYTGNDDNGFIAFYDDEGHIIQLGNPDAENLDDSAKAGIIYNANMDNITAATFSSSWSNIGTGSIANVNFNDPNFNRGTGFNHRMIIPVYGSSTASENGPKMKYTAASAFQNYLCSYLVRIDSRNTTTDRGMIRFFVRSSDDNLFGISITKSDSSASAVVAYWVDSKIIKSERIDISTYNEHFGWAKKTAVYKYVNNKIFPATLPKNVNKFITYKQVLDGYTYSNVNGNLSFRKSGNSYIFKCGNLPTFTYTYARTDGSTITFNALEIDFLRKNGYTYLESDIQQISCFSLPGAHFTDQKNVFQAGDVIEADCKSANIIKYTLNSTKGQPAPQYGALGNDWETFILEPGNNTIKATWSDWATNPPNLKIIYNEVFI